MLNSEKLSINNIIIDEKNGYYLAVTFQKPVIANNNSNNKNNSNEIIEEFEILPFIVIYLINVSSVLSFTLLK